MKFVFYLLTILFLSLLISCSEEPPTGVESETLTKKPVKPDPPVPPGPLPELDQNTKYIVGNVRGFRRSDPKIFIWDGSDLNNKWSRTIEAVNIVAAGVGNFIGDDDKELIVQRRIGQGRGRNKVERLELLIFEKGEIEPSHTKILREFNGFHDGVWDMKIGDVDGDEDLEIVILFRDQIEIYECDGNGFSFKASKGYYNSSEQVWRADIGDFDPALANGNEIIVAFSTNMWRVYKDNGSTTLTLVKESSSFDEFGNLNCARMSNVDLNSDIEVIGGSYPSKLLLWEDPYTVPEEIVFKEFSSAPWAIGIGDFDNDPSTSKEILAGLIEGGLNLLYYDGTSFSDAIDVAPGLLVGQDGIIVTDINNNSILDIIVKTGDGLRVYFDNIFSIPIDDNVGSMETLVCQ